MLGYFGRVGIGTAGAVGGIPTRVLKARLVRRKGLGSTSRGSTLTRPAVGDDGPSNRPQARPLGDRAVPCARTAVATVTKGRMPAIITGQGKAVTFDPAV